MSDGNDAIRTLFECFPFPSMRDGQKKTLREIDEALKSGVNDFILDLPVGFGKSPIAATMARHLGHSYILVGTKDLQAQYLRDFKWMFSAKGKSNFTCPQRETTGDFDATDPSSLLCTNGPCTLDKNFQCKFKPKMEDYMAVNRNTVNEVVNFYGMLEDNRTACGYYDQKYRAIAGSHSVLNYAIFLTMALFGQGIPFRNLMVFDEAHELEDHLTEFQGMTLTAKIMQKFFDGEDARLPRSHGEDISKWMSFLESLAFQMKDWLDSVEQNGLRNTDRMYSDRNIKEAEELLEKLKRIVVDYQTGTTWIVSGLVDDQRDDKALAKISFKPLDVKPLAKKIFRLANKRVFMSGTILGKEAYCEIVGLDPSAVKYISVDSEFPIQHRPIYSLNAGQLNFKSEATVFPKFIDVINEIMTKHKGQKGIIHVSKKAHINAIKFGISRENSRRLMATATDEEFVNREQLVEQHKNSGYDSVLISPSLHTGLDLKDDLSRFQIIVKILYPDLSDRVVAGRKNLNPRWYTWKTALKVVQAYGRSVRTKEDWATTYVLDSNLRTFLWQSKGMLPEWFTKAIKNWSVEAIPAIPVEITPTIKA
jgi:ATP-dependent DNA helicase DinG